MAYPIVSADSHITEPPNCYVDHIDPAWRERAPHVVHKEGMGDIYVVEGMKTILDRTINDLSQLLPKLTALEPEMTRLGEALMRADATFWDLDGVAATLGPGLIGSLLVGVAEAKSIAAVLEVPFVEGLVPK
mgnify:CR=1 FL=1